MKQFENEMRSQMVEAARKLSAGDGEEPSPAAILAMLGYQMYLDQFFLNPSRIKELVKYLMVGQEMAKEDMENDSNLKFFN